MIVFELYRQLDVRMFHTVEKLVPGFRSCDKYVLQDDCLIVLGTDRSVRLNLLNKEVSIDPACRNWNIESETALWFAEDADETAVIRMINNAFREWLEIEPFETFEEFEAAIIETNHVLSSHGMRVFWDKSGMCIFQDDAPVSYEQAVKLIMEDEDQMEAGKSLEEWLMDARYFRQTDQDENAIVAYERILRFSDRSMDLYTEAAFCLAELYYFVGNYERSVALYYRCNLDFITDQRDFYVHIGHALMDERMKNFEREIKIYYRSRLDERYYETHRRAVETAASEVADDFAEYEENCFRIGMKKYNEHRNLLPDGADDIDELLVVEKKHHEPVKELPKYRYENIHLVEPTRIAMNASKSDNELLSDALNMFIEGKYQDSFETYYKLMQDVDPSSDCHTWVMLQLGKMYAIFDSYDRAVEYLEKCDVNRFGVVYRKDDYCFLLKHVKNALSDNVPDERFFNLVRGKFDFYYAQYDADYLKLTNDKKLLRAFKKYEDECIKDIDSESAPEKAETVKKNNPIKNLSKFFKSKKAQKDDYIPEKEEAEEEQSEPIVNEGVSSDEETEE